MRRQLDLAGLPLAQFGWASVQLDGGMDKALARIEHWFEEKLAESPPATVTTADLGALAVGFMTAARVTANTAAALAAIVRDIVTAGGAALVPESDPLLANESFVAPLIGSTPAHATLAYGQPFTMPGLHIVDTETTHWVENLTGLGGCGAHLALTVVSEHAQQGHPLLPVIQSAEASQRGILPADDIDLFLSGIPADDQVALTRLMVAVTQRTQIPVANAQGFVDFQLTRGLLGLTT